MEPVYYGQLGTNKKCPDYQIVLIFQVSLYDKASFGTIIKCVDYMQVSLFSSVLINRFHCIYIKAKIHYFLAQHSQKSLQLGTPKLHQSIVYYTAMNKFMSKCFQTSLHLLPYIIISHVPIDHSVL